MRHEKAQIFSSAIVKVRDKMKVKTWLGSIIEKEGFALGNVNIIFSSDHEVLELNRKYRSSDYLTDIITFDYTEGKKISGDLYISQERILENAELFSVPVQNEMLRVIAHGLLHLMGYKDKLKKDIDIMRSKEDLFLTVFQQHP